MNQSTIIKQSIEKLHKQIRDGELPFVDYSQEVGKRKIPTKKFVTWYQQEMESLATKIRESERAKLLRLISDCNPDQGQPELASCYNEWSGELIAELEKEQS